jgi:hypothetical protein
LIRSWIWATVSEPADGADAGGIHTISSAAVSISCCHAGQLTVDPDLTSTRPDRQLICVTVSAPVIGITDTVL